MSAPVVAFDEFVRSRDLLRVGWLLTETDAAASLGVAVGSVKRYAADVLAKLRSTPSLTGLVREEVSG